MELLLDFFSPAENLIPKRQKLIQKKNLYLIARKIIKEGNFIRLSSTNKTKNKLLKFFFISYNRTQEHFAMRKKIIKAFYKKLNKIAIKFQ